MTQVEKVKIFLASPHDVSTERRRIKTVIDELNRHLAAAHGVVLEVISSDDAIPGVGKDGQSIVNQQIARMSNYDLFIGIMWKRIGTPTARAKSGTVEEYERAIRTFKRIKRPEIWFYFRKPITKFKNKEEETQQKEVLKFRKRVGRTGLFRDYTSPADFAKQLREHLTSWLIKRKRRRKASPASATTKKRSLASKGSASHPISRGPQSVQSPGSWVMLNNTFFETTSTKRRPDHSVILRISLTDREKIAQLRSFYPQGFYRSKQVTYADSFEASIMEVIPVHEEVIAGETIFDIELKRLNRAQGLNLFSVAAYGNYNAHEIATFHARRLLLGEPLPPELARFYPKLSIVDPSNHSEAVETPIFPALWTALNTTPKLFLPKAWLWAAYYLKMSNIVEDILELKVGPIKNKVMAIHFRGKRSSGVTPLDAIEVAGKCSLSQ